MSLPGGCPFGRGSVGTFVSGPTWVTLVVRVVVSARVAGVPSPSILVRLWGVACGCRNGRVSFRLGGGGCMFPAAAVAGVFGLVPGWCSVGGCAGCTIAGCPSRRYHTLCAAPLCMNGVLNGLTINHVPVSLAPVHEDHCSCLCSGGGFPAAVFRQRSCEALQPVGAVGFHAKYCESP